MMFRCQSADPSFFVGCPGQWCHLRNNQQQVTGGPRSGVYTPTDNANQQYGPDTKPLLTAVTIMGWGRSEGTPYWLVGDLSVEARRMGFPAM